MMHIARQAILDIGQNIYGYELLYRGNSIQNAAPDVLDGNKATRTVICDSITAFGIDKLTNNGTAFINFTRELIMGEVLSVINPAEIIVEILEDTIIDDKFIQRIKFFYEQGYRFAIDDYTGETQINKLLPYVNIIKVDWMLTKEDKIAEIAKNNKKNKKILLAEKIETEEEYERARKLGYSLFQGYYFERPQIQKLDIPNVQNMTCMRAFDEAMKPELNFKDLADVVRSDMSLSYKVLKHVARLEYYRGQPVTDIADALVRMGAENIQKWMSLVFLREISSNENTETIKNALIRAVFAEKIAGRMKLRAYRKDAYLCGLFSLLEASMGEHFKTLLNDIWVSDKLKETLIEHKGILYDIILFVKNYQICLWDLSIDFLEEHELYNETITMDYMEAIRIADETFGEDE